MDHVSVSSSAESTTQSGHATNIMPGPSTPSPDMPQTFTRSTAISVAVDPVALITTECIAVTSAMRKHARWAHSSVSAILGGGGAGAQSQAFALSVPPSPRGGPSSTGPAHGRPSLGARSPTDSDGSLAIRWGLRGKKGKSMQDNPLMSAFARLRNDLAGCKGWELSPVT